MYMYDHTTKTKSELLFEAYFIVINYSTYSTFWFGSLIHVHVHVVRCGKYSFFGFYCTVQYIVYMYMYSTVHCIHVLYICTIHVHVQLYMYMYSRSQKKVNVWSS